MKLIIKIDEKNQKLFLNIQKDAVDIKEKIKKDNFEMIFQSQN